MKKTIIAALLAFMAVISFTGCGTGKSSEMDYRDEDIVASVGDIKMDYSTMLTYSKIMQSEAYSHVLKQVESISPTEVWRLPLDEDSEFDTYVEQYESETLQELKVMLVSEKHMSEYGVEFTDEDKKRCEEAADYLLEHSNKEAVEAMHADKEVITNVMRLMTIKSRVKSEILYRADRDSLIDKDLNEEDIRQATYNYVTVNHYYHENPEADAELIIQEIESGKEFKEVVELHDSNPYTASYTVSNPEYDEHDEEMLKAAEQLQEGEITSYTNKNGDVTVVQMKSIDDKEAEETKKSEILNKKISEYYDETINNWIKSDGVEVDIKAWEDVGVEDFVIFRRLDKTDPQKVDDVIVKTGIEESTTDNVTDK